MNETKKILIVDDEEETRKMYAEVFRKAGFAINEAVDGIDALDKATKEIPDAIFTGIIMPRMDGFSLMEALKKNVITAGIPVIISSHMGREEDRQKANVLGARHFVVRGFTTPREVVKKIASLFDGGKEYRLEINNRSLDAPLLAQECGLNNDFECLECNDTLILKLITQSQNEKGMEAHLICPSCGWQAK